MAEKFSRARLRNLTAPVSDHSPTLLETEVREPCNYKHNFRFEYHWFSEQELYTIIEVCWVSNRDYDIMKNLNYCSEVLDQWGKKVDGTFRNNIRRCNEQLENLRDKYDEESIRAFKDQNDRLASLLMQEEDYWCQRGNKFWLKDGDRNARFFHSSASVRKKTNKINLLKDANGNWQEEQNNICAVVQDYFQNLISVNDNTQNYILE